MKNQEFYDKPKIGVIILSFNNFIDTYECLQSIIDSKTNLSIEICVIDNSPDDNIYLQLKNKFPIAHFIKTEKNLGYAHGNNIGINYFISLGVSKFVVLNNDTIVSDFFIDELIKIQKSENSIISPLIYSYYNKNSIWSYGGYWSKIHSTYKLHTKIVNNNKVDFLSGCCILLNENVISKIGLISEEYFMYGEDSEYSYRAKEAKISLMVSPLSIIYHKISKSSIPNSPFHYYYLFRGRFVFIYRNFKNSKRLYSILNTLLILIFYLFKHLLINNKISIALIHAFIDRHTIGPGRY